jgi:hypothetical protein
MLSFYIVIFYVNIFIIISRFLGSHIVFLIFLPSFWFLLAHVVTLFAQFFPLMLDVFLMIVLRNEFNVITFVILLG